jgi:SAM-dependent methyltransferase
LILSDPVADLKQKAKTTWALGSYIDIATLLSPMSAHLVRAAGVSHGENVLDVACGTGITAITACRAEGKVIGLDITPELLERAKEEAAIAGLTQGIEWKEGDAEDLPFPDNSFDIVLSSLGHMFTPRPTVAAEELVRVTKEGGRIAFTTWPPESTVGRFFAAIGRHIPPPPNSPPSPMQWGIPEIVRERLGSNVNDLHFQRGAVYFPLLSPNHFWLLFSTKYGPMMRAIQALGGQGTTKVKELEHDFVRSITPYVHENLIRLDYLLTLALKM